MVMLMVYGVPIAVMGGKVSETKVSALVAGKPFYPANDRLDNRGDSGQ